MVALTFLTGSLGPCVPLAWSRPIQVVMVRSSAVQVGSQGQSSVLCTGPCPAVSSRLTSFLERVVWSCPCAVSLALSCAQAVWVMARTVLAASPELETSTAALHPTLLTEAFVPSVMPAEVL